MSDSLEQPERKSTPRVDALTNRPGYVVYGSDANDMQVLAWELERDLAAAQAEVSEYAAREARSLKAQQRELEDARAERDRLRAALEAQEEAERAEEDHLAHLGGMGVAKSKAAEDEERAKEFILGRLARKAAAKAKALRAAALSSETLAGSGSGWSEEVPTVAGYYWKYVPGYGFTIKRYAFNSVEKHSLETFCKIYKGTKFFGPVEIPRPLPAAPNQNQKEVGE